MVDNATISDVEKDIKTVAKTELGETLEVKEKCLAELKHALQQEPGIHLPDDDDVLIMFLRASKFKVAETLRKIKKYVRARNKIPEYFENLTPSNIPYQTVFNEHKLIKYAKERDHQGRAVGYVNYGAWSTSICSMDEFARCVLVAVEAALQEEEVQVRGGVGVVDLKGFSPRHLAQLTPRFARRAIALTQDTMPIRIKGLYFINSPPLTETLYNIVKSFLSNKIQQRLHFIGSDLSQLSGVIPSELLPENIGGTSEEFDLQRQENVLLGKANYFEKMLQCSYTET